MSKRTMSLIISEKAKVAEGEHSASTFTRRVIVTVNHFWSLSRISLGYGDSLPFLFKTKSTLCMLKLQKCERLGGDEVVVVAHARGVG